MYSHLKYAQKGQCSVSRIKSMNEINQFLDKIINYLDNAKKFKKNENVLSLFLNDVKEELKNVYVPDLRNEDNRNCYYVIEINMFKLSISYQYLVKQSENFLRIFSSNDIYTKYFPLKTVDEYALENNISVDIVRQWIRRGRFTCAKKYENNWLISSLSSFNSKKHRPEMIEYKWNGKILNNPEECLFMNEYTNVRYSHSRKEKDKYLFNFYNRFTDENKKIELSKKEGYKLELFLRRNPLIDSSENTILIADNLDINFDEICAILKDE